MYPPANITAFDVLSAIEIGLMEKAGTASPDKMPELDRALAAKVFDPLDESIRNALMATSLEDILNAMDQEAESTSVEHSETTWMPEPLSNGSRRT